MRTLVQPTVLHSPSTAVLLVAQVPSLHSAPIDYFKILLQRYLQTNTNFNIYNPVGKKINKKCTDSFY